jgi:hypothetical protein
MQRFEMTRPRNPTNLTAYSDVKGVLETAMRIGQWPARYSLSSKADAIRWRHRANTFRSALRKNEEIRLDLPVGTGTSEYDALVFRLDDCQVIIDLQVPKGTLEIGGQIVEVEDETSLLPDMPDFDGGFDEAE